MAGYLTTHVLDTTRGRPAAGMHCALWRLDQAANTITRDLRSTDRTQRSLLLTVQTNAQGRTDEPLLAGAEMRAGAYELVFAVGAYFMEQSRIADKQADEQQQIFLDSVPLRFVISAPDEHYHVPLLVSPFAYSTYRGS